MAHQCSTVVVVVVVFLGEIKAHRHPINAICTNSSCVFTASRLVDTITVF